MELLGHKLSLLSFLEFLIKMPGMVLWLSQWRGGRLETPRQGAQVTRGWMAY